MTTSKSPFHALKAQADKIASTLKAAERGAKIDARFAEKIAAARANPSFKVGIVMDDKVINVEIPWTTIDDTTEPGLAEYVLRLMRGARDVVN